jgi:CRP-like cAMP-binding protein
VQRVGLLHRLSDADRADLVGRGTERRFRAGTTLFNEGDASDWVVGILEGRVKVAAITEDGREVVLAVCTPGEVLGELAAVDGRPRSATATSIDEVRAVVVPVAEVRDFLGTHPEAAMLLLESVAERLRDADRREVEYAALDSIGRVASRLVQLAERFGVPADDGVRIELPFSQDELAGWTGCSREAVGKALQSLRRRGSITTGRRSITVLDLEGLRGRAGLTA